jgi:hypothetical protein
VFIKLTLPEAKTYEDGPGFCIYCPASAPAIDDLRREHIIPIKLGGQLVLHRASCTKCQDIINKEIETPTLTRMWLAPRTHLGLKTSQKRNALRVGRWRDTGEAFPPDMGEVEFRWDDIPLSDHPFVIIHPWFRPPGILWNEDPTKGFHMWGTNAYVEAKPPVSPPGERTANFEPFNPDLFCRSIAKIAHSAAMAEFGAGRFVPLLPNIIMRRSPHISHLVGGSLI